MKLANYKGTDGQTQVGVVQDESIVSLESCGITDSLLELLDGGIDVSAVEGVLAKGTTQSIADLQLLAPIEHPGKVLGIGLNYADHIAESGMETPEHQMWFNKQRNCITGPYSGINLPAVSSMLDYEAELCLVISRRCKHVPRDRAHEVIGGYFCGNDVSVRDWQMRSSTMQIGKSFDTHGPIGPYLVTPDEVGDPHNLDISCIVNAEVRQSSNTRHLIFDCFDAIAHLSQAFTLDVGDVLFMGTSSGVGVAMKPPVWLEEGDVVRVEIEKLGYIENTVVPEEAQTIIE